MNQKRTPLMVMWRRYSITLWEWYHFNDVWSPIKKIKTCWKTYRFTLFVFSGNNFQKLKKLEQCPQLSHFMDCMSQTQSFGELATSLQSSQLAMHHTLGERIGWHGKKESTPGSWRRRLAETDGFLISGVQTAVQALLNITVKYLVIKRK